MRHFIYVCICITLLAGCASTPAVKPLTPTEVQVIAQVISHRLLAPKVTDDATRQTIAQAIESAKTALETTNAADLLTNLGTFLGPDNKDIADLIVVLVKERVDLTQIPEIQGKAYVWSVLEGVAQGLH